MNEEFKNNIKSNPNDNLAAIQPDSKYKRDYLSTFAQPVYYEATTQQPLPMQTLPLYLQQPPVQQQYMQQAPTQQHMHQPPMQQQYIQQPPMQQQYMQQPYLQSQAPSGQMNSLPNIMYQRSLQPESPPVQFTDYEQLSMLTEGIPITAESVQYLNGFLRTQIGRRVRVEFLIGTNMFVDKIGTLLGVGVNFIIINEVDTDDITACDFYNIRFIKFYY